MSSLLRATIFFFTNLTAGWYSPFFDERYRLLLPHLYALPYRSRLGEILRDEQPDLIEICDKYTLSFLPSVPAGVGSKACRLPW
jgi:hypothetical protein